MSLCYQWEHIIYVCAIVLPMGTYYVRVCYSVTNGNIVCTCAIVLPVGEWMFDMQFVPEDNTIYYSDEQQHTINVIYVDTQKITILAKVYEPRGIAVDRKMG